MTLPAAALEAMFDHLDILAATLCPDYIEWHDDAVEHTRHALEGDPSGYIPPMECTGFSIGRHSNTVFETLYAAHAGSTLSATMTTALCFGHKDMSSSDMRNHHTLVRPGVQEQPALCEMVGFSEAGTVLPLPWGMFAYDEGNADVRYVVVGSSFAISPTLALPDILITSLDAQLLPAELALLTVAGFWDMMGTDRLVPIADVVATAHSLLCEPDGGGFMVGNPTHLMVNDNLRIAANRPYERMQRLPIYGQPYTDQRNTEPVESIDIHRAAVLKRSRGLAFLRNETVL